MGIRNSMLLADDHAMMREGIRALLAEEVDLEIVGEVDNGLDAVRLACSLRPRLVIMDISLPGINGIEAIAEIKRREPEIKVLVVTLHKSDEYVQAALRVGASGYLIKESGQAELLTAIRMLLAGKVYLSREISERVVNRFLSLGMVGVANSETLTLREREVLKLVAEGNANKDIALILCLSVKTVEKHRASLRQKLGLRNGSMLTAYAIEHGYVTKSASRIGMTYEE